MKKMNSITLVLLLLCCNIFAQGITVSGTITTEPGCDEPVPGVTVLLENLETADEFQTVTGIDGTYSFDGLPSGENWVIRPSRATTDLCGIDEKDNEDLELYLTFVQSLPSEYARIAANVSANGELSLLDIILINRLINGSIDDFPVNWRFVDADHSFPIPNDPPNPNDPNERVVDYGFPSTLELIGLDQDAFEQDFIAIKMGDVNCSYSNDCDNITTCQPDCSRSDVPTIAICEPRVEGSSIVYPVRYYAPEGFDSEEYTIANITIDIAENQVPLKCATINEEATLASSPIISFGGTNLVYYNFFEIDRVELMNNELLFEIVLDGSANCCVTPTITNADFVYDLNIIPVIAIEANQCNPKELCSSSVTIQGTIETVNGDTEAVEGVEIIITDENGNQYCEGLMSGVDGKYCCEVLPDLTYTVRPVKDNLHCLGATYSDLVQLSNHLIGLVPFQTPFQYISADANNDSEINAYDLIDIQKVIICIEERFPNNTSWRFVDPTYNWGNILGPLDIPDFPEEIVLSPTNLLPNNLYIADFQAMKIGDINGSCPGLSCMSCCGETGGDAPKGKDEEEDVVMNRTVNQLLIDLEILMDKNLDESQMASLKSGYLISEVYPNPFDAVVSMEVFALKQNVGNLHLFDGTGKVVKTEQLQLETGMHHYQLNGLGNLPVGIYYAQILVDDHSMVHKLVKL